MTTPNQLSERELEILQMLATGASNKEIAQELFISANTVKVHLRNIFSKIEVTSRTEASMWAVRNGLVQAFPEGETAPPAGGNGFDSDLSEAEWRLQDRAEQGHVLPSTRGLVWWRRWWVWAGLALSMGMIALLTTLWPEGELPLEPTPQAPVVQSTAFDPSQRWQANAELPTPRAYLAIVVFDNMIYALGGETDGMVSRVVERYTPTEDRWEARRDKPTPVSEVQAAALGGLIFVPGGKTASGDVTDVLEIYDPRNDAWSVGEPLPVPLSAYALAAYEGRLYLFGGWDGQRFLDTVYIYTPAENGDQDSWLAATPMEAPRAFAGAVTASGRIHVIGGMDEQGPLTRHVAYLPAADQAGQDPWQAYTPLPEPRARMAVTGIADILYVLGGGDGVTSAPPLEYIPQQDAWQELYSPVAEAWLGLGAVPFQTNLHLIGGIQANKSTGEHLNYRAIFTLVIPVIEERP